MSFRDFFHSFKRVFCFCFNSNNHKVGFVSEYAVLESEEDPQSNRSEDEVNPIKRDDEAIAKHNKLGDDLHQSIYGKGSSSRSSEGSPRQPSERLSPHPYTMQVNFRRRRDILFTQNKGDELWYDSAGTQKIEPVLPPSPRLISEEPQLSEEPSPSQPSSLSNLNPQKENPTHLVVMSYYRPKETKNTSLLPKNTSSLHIPRYGGVFNGTPQF